MDNGYLLDNDRLFSTGGFVWQSLIWLRKIHQFRERFDLRAAGMARYETIKEKFLNERGWYACTIRPKGIRVNDELTPATKGMNYAAIINFRTKEVRLITVPATDEKLLEKGFTRVPMEIESPEMLVAKLHSNDSNE